MSQTPYSLSPRYRAAESGPSMMWAIVAMLLGLAVAAVGLFSLFMWSDARTARDDANRAPTIV